VIFVSIYLLLVLVLASWGSRPTDDTTVWQYLRQQQYHKGQWVLYYNPCRYHSREAAEVAAKVLTLS